MDKPLPHEKPLPSPPIATVQSASPIARRSIIDAQEQPLRDSPPLCPGKPQSKDSLAIPSDSPTAPITRQVLSREDAVAQSAQVETSIDATWAKEIVSGSKGHSRQPSLRHPGPSLQSSSIPRQVRVLDTSAAAASIENRVKIRNSLNLSDPRPTRTSSLRARFSHGEVLPAGPTSSNKITGFTDFTTIKADPMTLTPSRVRLSTSSATGSSSRIRRIPAARISPYRAGSRTRAKLTRRSPDRPSSIKTTPSKLSRTNAPAKVLAVKTVPRTQPTGKHQSSIPLPRRLIRHQDQSDSEAEVSISCRKRTGQEFKIFEDDQSVEGDVDTGEDQKRKRTEHKAVPDTDAEEAVDLFPTPPSTTHRRDDRNVVGEESYRVRRLSAMNPEHGPILRIASSADKVIFGERGQARKRKMYSSTGDLRRDVAMKEIRNSTDNVSLQSLARGSMSERPVSASVSLKSLFKQDREEKFMAGIEPEASAETPGTLLTAAIAHSCMDDPFVSLPQAVGAMEQNDGLSEMPDHTFPGVPGNTVSSPVNDSWISPVPSRTISAASHISRRSAVSPRAQATIDTREGQVQSVQGVSQEQNEKHDTILGKSTILHQAVPHTTPSPRETSSSPFPPRSSSRAAVMKDYTISTGSAQGPGLSATSTGTSRSHPLMHGARGSEDFQSTHHDSVATLLKERESSLKRDSTAMKSSRSQASAPKGKMLSNIRGIFHKRSSETNHANASLSKSNVARQAKVSVPHSVQRLADSPTVPGRCHPYIPLKGRSSRNTNTPTPILEVKPAFPNTPAFDSPMPSEQQVVTSVAMGILDDARAEQDAPRKGRLLEVSPHSCV